MLVNLEVEAAKKLIIRLLYEAHPKAVPHEELRTRFVSLVRKHGSAIAALKHLEGRLQ
jgi:hypothetical protein